MLANRDILLVEEASEIFLKAFQATMLKWMKMHGICHEHRNVGYNFACLGFFCICIVFWREMLVVEHSSHRQESHQNTDSRILSILSVQKRNLASLYQCQEGSTM